MEYPSSLFTTRRVNDCDCLLACQPCQAFQVLGGSSSRTPAGPSGKIKEKKENAEEIQKLSAKDRGL